MSGNERAATVTGAVRASSAGGHGSPHDEAREILIVAGEPSADLHASRLVQEIGKIHAGWSFFGVGGPRLAESGCEILAPMGRLTVMGFWDVLPKLAVIWRTFLDLEREVVKRLPSAAILLDFPDFNLRLARRLRRYGLPIIYYITPQVWAWREERVRDLGESTGLRLVILPFEKEFFAARGVETEYVGHPLLDHIRAKEPSDRGSGIPHIAILPGSREQEVRRCLPAMMGALRELSQAGESFTATVCLADSVREMEFRPEWNDGGVQVANQAEIDSVLSRSDAAMVVSGTATLQCAVHDLPMVVLYRTSWLNYRMARLFVRVKEISLVNLVLGRRCVTELVQGAVTPKAIAEAVRPLLRDTAERRRIGEGLALVRQRLGPPGASGRAAVEISRFICGAGHG